MKREFINKLFIFIASLYPNMNIYFVTGNKHKVEEAKIALKGSNVNIHLLDAEKFEPEDWTLEEVAKNNAKRIADETGKTVIVEDTGVFFEAFDNFPGNRPKRWFETLGYEGLLGKFYYVDEKNHKKNNDKDNTKKEITNRNAYFKTVIGYCEPNKEPLIFSGELYGKISKEVKGLEVDVLPYERIFICNDDRYLYEYSREEKDKFSHRGMAFRKLREFLLKKK